MRPRQVASAAIIGRDRSGTFQHRRLGTLLLVILIASAGGGARAQTADLLCVAAMPSSAVVGGTGGALFYTASISYHSFQPAAAPPLSVALNGAAHNTEVNYFVVGAGGTILYSSGPNGSAFVAQNSPTEETLYGVTPFSGRMVAVGGGGVLLTSESLLGGSWVVQETPTEETLYDAAVGPLTGIAVGANGTLLKGNTSGGGWEWVDSPVPGADLRGVAAIGSAGFIAVGLGGTVIRSWGSGEDWDVMSFPPEADLFDVAVDYDADPRVVAVGESGLIFFSDNLGESWAAAESPVHETLRSVVFTGNLYFLAAGDHGSLARSPDGSQWTDLTPVGKTTWGGLKGRFR